MASYGYRYDRGYDRTFNKRKLPIDELLSRRGLKRKYIAKDGSCLFRAVAEQAWHVQALHWDLRRQCALHIKRREEHFKSFITIPLKDYCFQLANSSLWGGEPELAALSELLNRSIVVYSEERGEMKTRWFGKEKSKPGNKSIKLVYTGSNHYDIAWNDIDERNYKFCQGIVYEMLYKNVFKNPKLPAEARMLSLNDILCGTMSQYPQDLLKALSWYVYSNVPLELALKEKKSGELIDRNLAASLQFKAGEHCQVKYDDQVYPAVITGVSHKTTGPLPMLNVQFFDGFKCTVSANQIVLYSNKSDKKKRHTTSSSTTKRHSLNRRSMGGTTLKTTPQKKAQDSSNAKSSANVKSLVTTPPQKTPPSVTPPLKTPPTQVLPIEVTKQDDTPTSSRDIDFLQTMPLNVSPPRQQETTSNVVPLSWQQSTLPPPIGTPSKHTSLLSEGIANNTFMAAANDSAHVYNPAHHIDFEAPECEWPILNPTNSNRRYSKDKEVGGVPSTLHIDGPPVESENIIPAMSPQHQYNSSDVLFRTLITELAPPISLLHNKTHVSRQQFMFEYAHKCLRLYIKYINDSEVEDHIEELLCMTFEEFIAPPTHYVDQGQFSLGASLTSGDDIEEPHPRFNLIEGVSNNEMSPKEVEQQEAELSQEVEPLEDNPTESVKEEEGSDHKLLPITPPMMPPFPYQPQMYPVVISGYPMPPPWYPVPYGMPAPMMMVQPRPFLPPFAPLPQDLSTNEQLESQEEQPTSSAIPATTVAMTTNLPVQEATPTTEVKTTSVAHEVEATPNDAHTFNKSSNVEDMKPEQVTEPSLPRVTEKEAIVKQASSRKQEEGRRHHGNRRTYNKSYKYQNHYIHKQKH